MHGRRPCTRGGGKQPVRNVVLRTFATARTARASSSRGGEPEGPQKSSASRIARRSEYGCRRSKSGQPVESNARRRSMSPAGSASSPRCRRKSSRPAVSAERDEGRRDRGLSLALDLSRWDSGHVARVARRTPQTPTARLFASLNPLRRLLPTNACFRTLRPCARARAGGALAGVVGADRE
jgi:hypothetical protein